MEILGKVHTIPVWAFIAVGCVIFLMLVMILILSICLCRVSRRLRKQILTEVPHEADLYYAELQNLPDSSRGQCDGGTCSAPPTVRNSDYATVAELQRTPSEDGGCHHEQKEDERLGVGVQEEEEPFVGPE